MRNFLRNLDDRFKHTQSDKGSGRPPRCRQDDPVAVFRRDGKENACLHVKPSSKAVCCADFMSGRFDFALRPGECVSIGGKSGAGKSVLLRMVAILIRMRAMPCWTVPRARHAGTEMAAQGDLCRGRVRLVGRARRSAFLVGDGFSQRYFLQSGFPPKPGPGQSRGFRPGNGRGLALLRALSPENCVLLLDERRRG